MSAKLRTNCWWFATDMVAKKLDHLPRNLKWTIAKIIIKIRTLYGAEQDVPCGYASYTTFIDKITDSYFIFGGDKYEPEYLADLLTRAIMKSVGAKPKVSNTGR